MYKEKDGNKYVLVKNISGKDLKWHWATNDEVKIVKGIEILGYYLQMIAGFIRKKCENVKLRYCELKKHYKENGLWKFIKWQISGRNFYFRRTPDNPIFTFWTLKELLFYEKSDWDSSLFQHGVSKSFYAKTLVPVHRYSYKNSVLCVPIILYPFVKLYFILKKLYYLPVKWLFHNGYITIGRNEMIPRFWFLKLHRRQNND